MSAKKRTIGSVIGGTLLNLAATGGVVCIIAVIAAFAFNITLIMFKTGSMSPTIPAGSLAVVRQIPASEIRVGDVVTVDRAGKPPITHRVRAISPAGGDACTITTCGDANMTDDLQPYTVSHVRIVLLSVPGLAYAVVTLSHPLVLGGITLGAAALVFWAFWPREAGTRRRGQRVTGTATTTDMMTLGVLPIGLIPLVLAFSLGTPAPAHAAEKETVVHGRYLTLTAIGDPDVMEHLVPGRPSSGRSVCRHIHRRPAASTSASPPRGGWPGRGVFRWTSVRARCAGSTAGAPGRRAHGSRTRIWPQR